MENKKMIRGMSVCNPVDIKHDYLMRTVEYAIENGFDHVQFIGPIHNPVKGNIDGMTIYHKYEKFNDYKDMDFLRETMDSVNEACEKLHAAQIKTYVWHHELEVPPNFICEYPELCNETGDVEITHPIIRDFLEHKLNDFFDEYPLIDGIILTLHETRIPLLKLHNQRLDKKDRIKYVTQILYDTCKSRGKELIVRTFASIDEDYEMMLCAYEEISSKLVVMDKWTQFDWSLTLPHNGFFRKIKSNPLLVETDIFGEFFGKGRLPLMLKEHIREKFEYCQGFHPIGYVSRVDRGNQHPFGRANEVNINIMNAYMCGEDVDKAIENFFKKKYPDAYKEVRALMEPTEEILRKMIYLKDYYFSELSAFPSLNHSKNHFYFEMMRDDYEIASNEWFVPYNWKRGTIESVIEEKESAEKRATQLFDDLKKLESRIDEENYNNLYLQFANLKYSTSIWTELTHCFIHYSNYFETWNEDEKDKLLKHIKKMRILNKEGKELLGDKFYCTQLDIYDDSSDCVELVENFATELLATLEAEEYKTKKFENEKLTDFVVCGGAAEGHKLKKEVCFSDTFLVDGEPCRIPGNWRGADWSIVNTHGWFSYEVKVNPKCHNTICVEAGSDSNIIAFIVTIGDKKYVVNEQSDKKEFAFDYFEDAGASKVRVRIDRMSVHTPCIYSIKVK